MTGYFDANATTPLRPEARTAWLEGVDRFWANPSSPYRLAGEAHRQLERCRNRLGELLGVPSGELVFTSGATEANHAFIQWVAERMRSGALRSGLWVSPIEHPCVTEAVRHHLKPGEVRILTVDAQGRVESPPAEDGEVPGMVSLMLANNETGVMQPVEEWAEWCAARGVLLHCDAVQLPGKGPLAVLGKLPVFVLSAHKFGGPKGVGLLRISGAALEFTGQRGGAQENGHRAGTENLPGILGMTAALEAVAGEPLPGPEGRDAFEAMLPEDFVVIGQEAPRLPNTSMVIPPDGDQLRWVRRLDRGGFQVSTGSACSTGKESSSVVLAAMGLDSSVRRRVLRLSSLPGTPVSAWQALAETMRGMRDQG